MQRINQILKIPKFWEKWKFDSLLHCEDIRVEYDLEEIISKILNLYCKKFSVNFVRWENFSGYATLRSLSFYRPQSMNIREDFSLMSNNIQNKNLRGSLQAKNGFRQRGDYWSLSELNWIFSMVNLMTRQVFYRVPNWVEMWQNWISQSCILWPGDDYDDDKWSRWRRKRSDVLIFYKNVRTDSLWLIFAKIISTFLLVVHHQHPHW